ncbi:MAG: LytR C-terminal domain-containing protein [Actinomycetales bacterium]
MAGVRVGLDRPRPRRSSGPSAGAIIAIVTGMVVLFALGFGIALITQGAKLPTPSVAAASPSQASGSPAVPLPCSTTLVIPAEVLPRPAKVKVNVVNATKRKGLAAETALALKLAGFKILEVSNVPDGRRINGFAEVRHGPRGLKQANLVHFYVPDAVMVEDTRNDKTVDVVLGKEFSVIASQAEAAASMASPAPSTSGPGCVSGGPSEPAPAAGGTPADASSAPMNSPVPSLTPSPTPTAS